MGPKGSSVVSKFDKQLEKIKNDKGFIAALDQSGGSTPKALKLYGVNEDAWTDEKGCTTSCTRCARRIVTSPAFSGKRLIGAILFENTMDRDIEGKPTPTYLWDVKGVVPFLKVDKGLADEKDGVQLMKPIGGLDALLKKAKSKDVFGTKMRSVIKQANPAGIDAVVKQQFEIGKQIIAAGLVPIIEPEVDIKTPNKAGAEELLKAAIPKELNALKPDQQVMLKLTIPDKDNLYADLIKHKNVLRVVALSGGYSRDEANKRLARNNGMTASFSRALAEGLTAQQSDKEFNARSTLRSRASIARRSPSATFVPAARLAGGPYEIRHPRCGCAGHDPRCAPVASGARRSDDRARRPRACHPAAGARRLGAVEYRGAAGGDRRSEQRRRDRYARRCHEGHRHCGDAREHRARAAAKRSLLAEWRDQGRIARAGVRSVAHARRDGGLLRRAPRERRGEVHAQRRSYLGEAAGGGTSARAEEIAKLVDAAGVRCEATPDIRTREWSKFAGWIPMFLLAVLTRQITWKFLTDPQTAVVVVRIARETAALAAALQIELVDMSPLPVPSIVNASEERAIEIVRGVGKTFFEKSPEHRMSAQQDVLRGSRLESAETVGYALEKSRAVGVPMPTLDSCYRILSVAHP